MVNAFGEEEIWRTIPGFSGFGVSSEGRVVDYSTNQIVNSVKNRSSKELWVSFTQNERSYRGPIWRLLLAGFYDIHDLRDIFPIYRDENPSNLDLYNLRWANSAGTPIIFRRGESGDWRRVRHYARRVKIVETGVIYDSVKDCAEQIGANPNAIYMCLRGVLKSHHGFSFAYED